MLIKGSCLFYLLHLYLISRWQVLFSLFFQILLIHAWTYFVVYPYDCVGNFQTLEQKISEFKSQIKKTVLCISGEFSIAVQDAIQRLDEGYNNTFFKFICLEGYFDEGNHCADKLILEEKIFLWSRDIFVKTV